jgi:hypothetical protein
VLGILYPNATSLETVLAALGGDAFTTEAILANPTGELPAILVDETLAGQTTQLGVTFTFSADLMTGIDETGLASFSFTNVSITSSSPLLQPGYLLVTTGSVHISVGCVADYDLDGGVTAGGHRRVLCRLRAGPGRRRRRWLGRHRWHGHRRVL